MHAEKSSRSRGCLKVLGIGCGAVVLMCLLVVVGILMNLDAIRDSGWFRSISEVAESAKTEIEHLMKLRSELIESFPAEEISVHAQTSMGANAGKSLVIQIVNPRFEMPDSEDGKREVARTIAAQAAGSYPMIDQYDDVKIAYVSKMGSGFTLRSTQNYSFAVAELLGVGEQAVGEAAAAAHDRETSGP